MLTKRQISPEIQLQNLDQTMCSKSEQKTIWPNFSFQICTKLSSTNFPTSTICNSKNLNKFWVGILKRQGHINQVTKQEWVSELVSDKHSQYDQTRVR